MKHNTYKISLIFILLLVYGAVRTMDPELEKSTAPLFLAIQVRQVREAQPVQGATNSKSPVIKNNGMVSKTKEYVCRDKECLFKTNYLDRFEAHQRCHDILSSNVKARIFHCTSCDYLTTAKATYESHLKSTGHSSID